jgi:hypothetical protein
MPWSSGREYRGALIRALFVPDGGRRARRAGWRGGTEAGHRTGHGAESDFTQNEVHQDQMCSAGPLTALEGLDLEAVDEIDLEAPTDTDRMQLGNGVTCLDVNDHAELHVNEIIVRVSKECRAFVNSGPRSREKGLWKGIELAFARSLVRLDAVLAS